MPDPNFFIVGAPKCGTTALAKYLSEHSHVFMCEPKEPHFFADDLPLYREVTDIDSYRSLFSEATPLHSAIGEASVFYMYSRVALKNIQNVYPDAKIIVLLRNPVDIVYSLHSTLVRTGDEDILDFGEAWQESINRRRNRSIPKRCRDPKLLYYDQVASLGSQLDNVYAHFPRSQVMCVRFESFAIDARSVFRDIQTFLSISDEGRQDFPIVNSNKVVRSRIVQRFLVDPPNWLYGPAVRIKKLLGIQKFDLFSRLAELNTRHLPRKPLQSSIRKEIVDNYYSEIQLLAKTTGLSLDSWIDTEA